MAMKIEIISFNIIIHKSSVFKFGTCIDPNFHFESQYPQVTKVPLLHVENLSNVSSGLVK